MLLVLAAAVAAAAGPRQAPQEVRPVRVAE